MNDESALQVAEPIARAADFLVVGVGIAAGRLEPLTQLLSALGPDVPIAPVADPARRRRRAGPRARGAGGLDAACTDRRRGRHDACAGRLYLAPPDAIVTIKAGRFRLRPPRTASERRNPVDRFFHGLAEAYGTRAVGVLLSPRARTERSGSRPSGRLAA
jgi:chemotaxis response regulator CheB